MAGATKKVSDKGMKVEAGQGDLGPFSMEELGVIYKGVMDLPLRRSDPAFKVASQVLAKVQNMSIVQAKAQQEASQQGKSS